MKSSIKRRSLTLVLSLAMIISLLVGLQIPAVADGDTIINILHTNDVHGRLYQVDSNNQGMMGIDKVAAIKKNTENSILVDVGDAIHGLPLVNINQGLNAIELMVAAGYDVMTPGNHDFNHGSARLSELAGIALEDGLHIISSNTFVKANGQSFLPTTRIVEIDGVAVGFFGLTTLEAPILTHPANVETLEFRAYKQSTENAIKALNDGGADVIVALAHIAREDIEALLKALDVKPDVVIEGHDHLLGSTEIEGVLVAGAGQYQENVGVVAITIGSDGKIGDIEASVVSKEDAEEFEGDAAVKALAEAAKAEVVEFYSEVVASSAVALSSFRGNDEGAQGVRNSEQPLGNLVADAMRILGEADVAMTNGGGLRADIKVGDLTKGDINSVLPFGNYLVIKEITPKELFELMEVGLQALPLVNGRFPQISGMDVEFIMARTALNRVTSISIDGKELDRDDDKTVYKLATNDFLAAGGDGYTILKDLTTVTELASLDDMLIEYITENLDGTISASDAKIDGRIVENPSVWAADFVEAAIEAGYVPANLQFMYSKATTRAEYCALAVTFYEAVTEDEIEGRSAFDDTDDVNVEKAAAIGLVQGYGDGNFGPGDELTREQAATILARLADALEIDFPESEATFDDNDTIASWAIEAVGKVQAAEIMEGVGDNKFAPKGAYTREQCIITIMRISSLVAVG